MAPSSVLTIILLDRLDGEMRFGVWFGPGIWGLYQKQAVHPFPPHPIAAPLGGVIGAGMLPIARAPCLHVHSIRARILLACAYNAIPGAATSTPCLPHLFCPRRSCTTPAPEQHVFATYSLAPAILYRALMLHSTSSSSMLVVFVFMLPLALDNPPCGCTPLLDAPRDAVPGLACPALSYVASLQPKSCENAGLHPLLPIGVSVRCPLALACFDA